MSYEAWIAIAVVLNTGFGAYAIWQRHQTYRALQREKFPKVHQPRTWEGTHEAGQDNQQDEGSSKNWPDRPICSRD